MASVVADSAVLRAASILGAYARLLGMTSRSSQRYDARQLRVVMWSREGLACNSMGLCEPRLPNSGRCVTSARCRTACSQMSRLSCKSGPSPTADGDAGSPHNPLELLEAAGNRHIILLSCCLSARLVLFKRGRFGPREPTRGVGMRAARCWSQSVHPPMTPAPLDTCCLVEVTSSPQFPESARRASGSAGRGCRGARPVGR